MRNCGSSSSGTQSGMPGQAFKALWHAPPEMRKAYLKLFVDNVIISKEEIQVSVFP